VDAVKGAVKVPVAVKLSPFFSSIAEMARRLDEAGADGLVLFNRFLRPEIDCETVATAPGVPLSTAAEIRLPLTWIALLHGRLRASLAATTGVESAAEVIKYLLAGADVVQSASALLRHGPEHAAALLEGPRGWMRRKGYTTLDDFPGMLAVRDDWAARERGDYVSALRDATAEPTAAGDRGRKPGPTTRNDLGLWLYDFGLWPGAPARRKINQAMQYAVDFGARLGLLRAWSQGGISMTEVAQ
jgi:dihydroorotate dehydrogenase (fumarate)